MYVLPYSTAVREDRQRGGRSMYEGSTEFRRRQLLQMQQQQREAQGHTKKRKQRGSKGTPNSDPTPSRRSPTPHAGSGEWFVKWSGHPIDLKIGRLDDIESVGIILSDLHAFSIDVHTNHGGASSLKPTSEGAGASGSYVLQPIWSPTCLVGYYAHWEGDPDGSVLPVRPLLQEATHMDAHDASGAGPWGKRSLVTLRCREVRMVGCKCPLDPFIGLSIALYTYVFTFESHEGA